MKSWIAKAFGAILGLAMFLIDKNAIQDVIGLAGLGLLTWGINEKYGLDVAAIVTGIILIVFAIRTSPPKKTNGDK